MGQPLYNANDGVTGRDGGPYLDEVEAREAEKRRAIVEKREPDLDNPPATAGIQLNTAAQMIYGAGPVLHPSQEHMQYNHAAVGFQAAADNDEILLTQRSEIPDAATEDREPLTEEEKSGPNIGDDLHAASAAGTLGDTVDQDSEPDADQVAKDNSNDGVRRDPAEVTESTDSSDKDDDDLDIVFTSDAKTPARKTTASKSSTK